MAGLSICRLLIIIILTILSSPHQNPPCHGRKIGVYSGDGTISSTSLAEARKTSTGYLTVVLPSPSTPPPPSGPSSVVALPRPPSSTAPVLLPYPPASSPIPAASRLKKRIKIGRPLITGVCILENINHALDQVVLHSKFMFGVVIDVSRVRNSSLPSGCDFLPLQVNIP